MTIYSINDILSGVLTIFLLEIIKQIIGVRKLVESKNAAKVSSEYALATGNSTGLTHKKNSRCTTFCTYA